MTRELSQFENYLVHEFVDDYVDGLMSRRDMMRRVLHITGGVATTATVLTQLGVKSASAQDGTPAPPPTPTGDHRLRHHLHGRRRRRGYGLPGNALLRLWPLPGRPDLS